jgi:ketosteroid isomerase-like protein
VSDREAIRALVVEYTTRLDAGDLDGVADLFADATFRSTRGGPARTGAEQVRRMYDRVVLYDDGTPRTKHVLGNLDVHIDAGGLTASSRCAFTVMQAAPGAPLRPVLAGTYTDRFSCIDGAWFFTERVVSPDLVGDLSTHMAPAR